MKFNDVVEKARKIGYRVDFDPDNTVCIAHPNGRDYLWMHQVKRCDWWGSLHLAGVEYACTDHKAKGRIAQDGLESMRLGYAMTGFQDTRHPALWK